MGTVGARTPLTGDELGAHCLGSAVQTAGERGARRGRGHNHRGRGAGLDPSPSGTGALEPGMYTVAMAGPWDQSACSRYSEGSRHPGPGAPETGVW